MARTTSVLLHVAAAAQAKERADVSPYPPMQWHSWGLFTHEDLVTEANMKEMGDALVSSGMAAAGYDTVNVVCNGWTGRDPVTNRLTENKTLWPNGMKGLSAYLKSQSPPIKLGCYTAPVVANCNCGPGSYHGCAEPGSLGNEALDMEFFAEIGCDHIMVDTTGGANPQVKEKFAKFSHGIAASQNPDMMFGVWSAGFASTWKWADQINGTYWRMAGDIYNSWGSVLRQWDTAYSVPEIASLTGPGSFPFLDQVGHSLITDHSLVHPAGRCAPYHTPSSLLITSLTRC
jgi:alpha-galactosidase